MPFGSVLSELDSSVAPARDRGDSELYLFSRLRTDKKVEHRAKKKMFVSGNTSYDKSGCGKLGFVEMPTKDSMFESYRVRSNELS